MDQRRVKLLTVMKVLAAGALLYSTSAQAIPGQPFPDPTTRFPTSLPDQPLTATPDPDSYTSDGQAASLLQANCPPGPTGKPEIDRITTGTSCFERSISLQRFSIHLGRHAGGQGDILGEFDGVRMDYRIGDELNLNGIAGYQALGTEDAFNPARQVYGISAEMAPTVRTWDLSSYYIEQQENGRPIDRSVGGAVRHMQPGRSMLVYLDYDVPNDAIGTLMTSGAWKLPFRTTVSATINRHHRPIPPRQQHYLTESMAVTQGWFWIVPTERLTHYSATGDRRIDILAGSLSHALTRRIQLNSDIVRLDVDDSETSPRTSEQIYHLELSGNDLFVPGDRSKLDLRHTSSADGETRSASIDTRFSLQRFWSVVSRLRADHIRPGPDGSARWVAAPEVKVEYRPGKQYGFHIEAGRNVPVSKDAVAAAGIPAYFVSLGYQVDF
jgi:hypothetical protein